MGEQKFEVVPYEVKYLCECGEEMKSTGRMFMSNPPQFPHKCEGCEKEINLTEKYPTIRWELRS